MAEHRADDQLQSFADIGSIAQQIRDTQSVWFRRKDTLTALIVFLGYLIESSRGIDWSDSTSWLPTVAVWAVAVIGIGIHGLTKGALTQSSVDKITQQAEQIIPKKEN